MSGKNTDLIQKFADFLAAEGLQDKKLLLCVSGGVDSMVLLHVAIKACDKNNLAVFHLDHQTRADSQQDAKLVQTVCEQFGVQFFGEVLKKSAEKNKEAFWRTERKNLAKKFAEKFGAVHTLTAHHATDLVETMLFRITKGCGPSGLSPFDTSTKPFWQIPKSVLIQYAQANEIKWHEDDSNTDETYERNNIRHQVLPALRKITPNLEKVFVTESQIFKKSADFLTQSVASHLKDDNKITLKEFLALPDIIQMELLRTVAGNISFDDLNDCLRWLQNNPGGNSQKNLGKSTFTIKSGFLQWQ